MSLQVDFEMYELCRVEDENILGGNGQMENLRCVVGTLRVCRGHWGRRVGNKEIC